MEIISFYLLVVDNDEHTSLGAIEKDMKMATEASDQASCERVQASP